MALTCRKMTVCRPDVVSIRVRFQDTQKSGAHLFFRIAALLSPSFYITCLWTCGLNLLRCAFLITVNCLLLFKRPLKLQPDQRGWSLKVLQGVAAVGVSLNYQSPLCCVMLRTGGSWLCDCSLSSIDCWLQNLNPFQFPVLQLVAPLFYFYLLFSPRAPPVVRTHAYFPNPENLNARTCLAEQHDFKKKPSFSDTSTSHYQETLFALYNFFYW